MDCASLDTTERGAPCRITRPPLGDRMNRPGTTKRAPNSASLEHSLRLVPGGAVRVFDDNTGRSGGIRAVVTALNEASSSATSSSAASARRKTEVLQVSLGHGWRASSSAVHGN